MKIHSDILTVDDLVQACPSNVTVDTVLCGSNSRDHGIVCSLEYWGEKTPGSGRRYKNSGQYGADHRQVAASYDEHGEWMVKLFAIDPNAIISYYKGVDDFHRQTKNKFNSEVSV